MKLVPHSSIIDTQPLWMEIYEGDVYDIASKLSYPARIDTALKGAYVYATRQSGTDLVKMYKSVRNSAGIYAPTHTYDKDSGRVYPDISIPGGSSLDYAKYNFLYRGQNPIVAFNGQDPVGYTGYVIASFGGTVLLTNIDYGPNSVSDLKAAFSGRTAISYLDSSNTWKEAVVLSLSGSNISFVWASDVKLPIKTTTVRFPVTVTAQPRTGFAFYGTYADAPPRTIDSTKRFAGLYTDTAGSNPIYLSITSDITKVRDYDLYMPDMSLSTSGDSMMPIAYTSSKFIEV